MKVELTKEEAERIKHQRQLSERYEKLYDDLFLEVKKFFPNAKYKRGKNQIREVNIKRGLVVFYVQTYTKPVTYNCKIRGPYFIEGEGKTPTLALKAAVKMLQRDYNEITKLLDELRL